MRRVSARLRTLAFSRTAWISAWRDRPCALAAAFSCFKTLSSRSRTRTLAISVLLHTRYQNDTMCCRGPAADTWSPLPTYEVAVPASRPNRWHTWLEAAALSCGDVARRCAVLLGASPSRYTNGRSGDLPPDPRDGDGPTPDGARLRSRMRSAAPRPGIPRENRPPPPGSRMVGWRATFTLVRKRGFEPPRSCDRQPLKLEPVNVDRSRLRKSGSAVLHCR